MGKNLLKYIKPNVLFAQRCHFSFAVFLYVGREECSTKDRLSGVVGDAVNSTWAQSAMVHNLCFCWVHDGLLAVSSATCVPHCLACLPVAALYLPALHCSSAAVNSLDRSLRRLRCVKGFYLSNCYKFLCRDGLRSPCDRFSCLNARVYIIRMKETTLVVGVAQSTWNTSYCVWRFWPCSSRSLSVPDS